MHKLTGFNKSTTAAFRQDLAAVLAKYGMEANLEFKIGTIRFSATDARMTLETKLKGIPTKQDRLAENAICVHNLRETNSAGDKIVGYNARAHAYPIIYTKASDGRRYKCSITHAKLMFGK